MIVFLPYKIYEQFKGDPFPRLSRSKCCRVTLECLFIFIVLVLPFTYILPFVNCGYFPLQSQLCRVSFTSIEICTINQILVSSLVPAIVRFIDFVGIFVVTIALSVVFCRLAREYRETRITLRRTLILLGFLAAYTIISIVFTGVLFGIMTDFDILTELLIYLEVLSMVIVVVLPVSQLMYPISFLFYLYSFNLFRWRAIKRAAAEWRCFRSCCGRENALQEAATAPHSHRVPAPSVTFFDVPHSTISTDNPNEVVVAEDMAL